jgi:CheY-like chemotaxis protein
MAFNILIVDDSPAMRRVVSRVEGRGKFALTHPEALSTLPDLHGQDALISRLDTDTGVITSWVTVERKSCL